MIKRILNLARKHKKLVVVDPETERAFVIIPLSVYERLEDSGALEDTDEDAFEDFDEEWTPSFDEKPWEEPVSDEALNETSETPLTEQSLIDSIDRDIAAWKAAQEQGAEEAVSAAAAPRAEPAANLDELTLTPVPGGEAPMTPPASAEEEKFYIEPVA
ncbi:MAG: hypothetical protein AAB633_02025 [Patescibacteria group bacterium]